MCGDNDNWIAMFHFSSKYKESTKIGWNFKETFNFLPSSFIQSSPIILKSLGQKRTSNYPKFELAGYIER